MPTRPLSTRPLSTRSALRPSLAVGVVLAVATTGCTSSNDGASAPTSSAASSAAPSSRPAKQTPRITVAGLPRGLAAVVTDLYAGRRVGADKDAAKALAKRRTSMAKVAAAGAVGTFKGSRIGVVTAGKDVTLAVRKGGKWQVVGGWWPSLHVKGPVLGGRRHVLLIGSDARVSKGQKVSRSRADSLHVLGLDGRGAAGVLGIPRDSWVPLSTGGSGKINAAMAYGGPGAQLRTVRSTTHLPVEGYLLTGFSGFEKAVNAFGGLRFDAPRSVIDPSHHNSGADVRKGRQKLTGKEALAYARERKSLPDGDFGRSRNQGLLLLAGAAMVRLSGPATLPQYLQELGPHVSTDLSAGQVLTLAASIFTVDPRKVHNEVATGGFGTRGGGQSVVLLGSSARRLFDDLRDGNLS